MSYSSLPTLLVQDTSPTFFSTSPSTATLSATPQINLLATDDDDEDDEDANDLLSTTLRATPTLVQKYRTSMFSTTSSVPNCTAPPQQLLYEASLRQHQQQQLQLQKAMNTKSRDVENDDDGNNADDNDEEEFEDEEEEEEDEEETMATSDDDSDDDDVDV